MSPRFFYLGGIYEVLMIVFTEILLYSTTSDRYGKTDLIEAKTFIRTRELGNN